MGDALTGRGIDILHLDMDCFFAAVETREDPSIVGRPVIVGGLGNRGVVAAASYEARVFGVHSAMPMSEARRLCPHAVYLRGRHDLYSSVSGELMSILRSTTPLVEPVSFDEAFLDVSGAHRLLGSSSDIARQLRTRVRDELNLTCSVGVGRTKLVAKLASRAAKPRVNAKGTEAGPGVVVVEAADERAFLDGHAIRAIPGVGPKTAERLSRIGITSVAELALLGRDRLEKLLGNASGAALYALAIGDDRRLVEPDRPVKSISHEETFEVDDFDPASLASRARDQAERVAARCRAHGTTGRTVSIKVRFGDFSTITRSRTLADATSSAAEIGAAAVALLEVVDVRAGVRLLGVGVSNLEDVDGDQPRQLDLFADQDPKSQLRARHVEAELATDEIRRRFGSEAIRSVAARERPERANGPTFRPSEAP